jgi:hypothetical protein
VPCSVTTALTAPPLVSTPRTAHGVSIFMPRARNALAIAGAARCGSARPSEGVKMPPANMRDAPGMSAAVSLPDVMRESMPSRPTRSTARASQLS